MKDLFSTAQLHMIYIDIDMSTLSCVTKASKEFLPCGLHPVTGQQAGEFLRISHSLNMCSGEATVCFWRKEPDMADLDSYIFVPTQQSKRFLALSNVRSPTVLNVCEANVAWCRSLESCVFGVLILEF